MGIEREDREEDELRYPWGGFNRGGSGEPRDYSGVVLEREIECRPRAEEEDESIRTLRRTFEGFEDGDGDVEELKIGWT